MQGRFVSRLQPHHRDLYPRRTMHPAARLRRISVGVVFALLVPLLARPAQSEGRQPQVNVIRVLRVFIAKDTPAFSVEYQYEFPGRTQVHIEGLGDVAASGHFRYVTVGRLLTFRDSRSGALLLTTPLRETVVVAARPPLSEIANETEFPSAYNAYAWRSSVPLPERAEEILNRHFRYRPFEMDGRTFIVTTFAPLQLRGLRDGVLAQIALMISFPYDPVSGRYNLHVQSLVREGRTHSEEFRPTVDDVIVRAASAFTDGIVREMEHAHP